jgi:hypothetical protein
MPIYAHDLSEHEALTSTLKLETASTFETSVALLTYTWCKHPRDELTSTAQYRKSLKSVEIK